MPARQRKKTDMNENATNSKETKTGKTEVAPNKLLETLKKREELDGSLIAVVTTILMGLVFGFALNKGRVAEPQVIVDQFRFARWTMMKMFLSAAGVSALTLSMVGLFFKNHFLAARRKYDGAVNVKGTVIGGLILGAGMAIGGACPGMVLIQLGCGVPNSGITLIGALCGAFTYGLTEPFFKHLFTNGDISANKAFLDRILNVNYTLLAFVFGSLLMGCTLFLESIFPWHSEINDKLGYEHVMNCDNMLSCRRWSPIIAGAFVGVLQFPGTLILGNTIGGASSYVVVTGQWLRLMPQKTKDYFSHFAGKLNYWWQVLYVVSAIFGSALAVHFGGGNVSALLYESFDGIQGNAMDKAFIGGFLMIFGARLAKGCTSGHGLSGMGLLSIASMIAVASMFTAGGIVGSIMATLNL